ncbi:MAG TPA: HAD family phosphatase [Ktedonobacterales bacterium]|nr:HAD family phosphatase [Ktedonobacterales bacterium]
MTDETSVRAGYAVIWDVDGVLLDSAEQHRQAWHALARENGFPYTDAAFWATFGMRNSDIIPRVFGVTDPARVAALGERKEAVYRELLARQATALPGAAELMAALHAAGYRQALGSSAPEENLRLIVRLLGIGSYLNATVSGETVARGKPAPDIFLAAAATLGVAPARCLVIEDAPAGVAAAHAGGMRALAVRRLGQADAPGLEAAERVVDSLRDVDVALVDGLLSVG